MTAPTGHHNGDTHAGALGVGTRRGGALGAPAHSAPAPARGATTFAPPSAPAGGVATAPPTGVSGSAEFVPMRWVGAVLRGRWRWVAAATVAGGLLGAAATVLPPVTYTATAQVAVRPVTLQPFTVASSGVDRSVSMPTEVAVATGAALATAVAADLHVPDTSGFRHGLTVTSPDSSQVLEFHYASSSAAEAEDRAAGFAAAYLRARSSAATAVARGQQVALDDREAALVARRAQLVEQSQQAVATAANPVEAAPLAAPIQSEITSIDTQVADIELQRTQLEGLDTSGGQVIGLPGTGDVQSSRGGVTLALVGAVGGLLCGVVAALVVERRRPRVRALADVKALTGADVVVVPPGAGRLARVLDRVRGSRAAARTHLRVDRAFRRLVSASGGDDPDVHVLVCASPVRVGRYVAEGVGGARGAEVLSPSGPGDVQAVDVLCEPLPVRPGTPTAVVVAVRSGRTRIADLVRVLDVVGDEHSTPPTVALVQDGER